MARRNGNSVAVVGTHSPARTLAMALALGDCIERHGWADRFRVFGLGFADGAGKPRAEELEMLAEAGLDVGGGECPDVEEHLELLEGASCLVVGCPDEAVMLLDWPEAEGKPVLALGDFLGEDGWALADPEADFGRFFEEVEEAAPRLLRALIAHRP